MTDDPDDPPDGYPLREALERFADPDKVRAYAEAARAAQHHPSERSSWLDRVPGDRWLSRRSQGGWLGERRTGARAEPYGHPSQPANDGEARLPMERALQEQARREDLRAQLLSGELVASGYQLPLRVNSCRVDIAPAMWKMLRPNFAKSTAAGSGLEVVDIRVRRARPAGTRTGQPHVARHEQGPTAAPSPATKRRGPRSLMDEIREEMRARARRNELRPKISEESAVLEAWVKRRFPDFKRPPKAKSIREALRGDYNRLKAATRAGK